MQITARRLQFVNTIKRGPKAKRLRRRCGKVKDVCAMWKSTTSDIKHVCCELWLNSNNHFNITSFYQRRRIASSASAGDAIVEMSVSPSVRPSVCPSDSGIVSKQSSSWFIHRRTTRTLYRVGQKRGHSVSPDFMALYKCCIIIIIIIIILPNI